MRRHADPPSLPLSVSLSADNSSDDGLQTTFAWSPDDSSTGSSCTSPGNGPPRPDQPVSPVPAIPRDAKTIRKMNHNINEKRRQRTLNQHMEDLRDMIPSCRDQRIAKVRPSGSLLAVKPK